MGIIYLHYLSDLDAAIIFFSRVSASPRGGSLTLDARLRLGETRTMQNDLQGARREYSVLSSGTAAHYRDQALYRLAELEYFEQRYDSALSTLKRLTEQVGIDAANDALLLQYFIMENQAGPAEALDEFVRADLTLRQNKKSEALMMFERLFELRPDALLADDVLMKIGDIRIQMNMPDKALEALKFIADSLHMSILKDKAQLRIGEVYERQLNNKEEAIRAYEKLLIKYPHSLFAEDARQRIRLLRGDAL
jgi:tetratricopeptide (TPR) repeat protein